MISPQCFHLLANKFSLVQIKKKKKKKKNRHESCLALFDETKSFVFGKACLRASRVHSTIDEKILECYDCCARRRRRRRGACVLSCYRYERKSREIDYGRERPRCVRLYLRDGVSHEIFEGEMVNVPEEAKHFQFTTIVLRAPCWVQIFFVNSSQRFCMLSFIRASSDSMLARVKEKKNYIYIYTYKKN